MKLVSPFLKHIVYPGLSRGGYLRRAAETGPAVLTYHGVLPAGYKMVDMRLDGNLVSASSFRQQLRFLKNRYTVISPEEFLLWCDAAHELPPRSVLLTCDDGLRNCLFDMLPILQEFEMECLFFVTGASLSHTATILWHEELYLMLRAAQEEFSLQPPEIEEYIQESPSAKNSGWGELVKKLSQHNPERRKGLLETIKMQLRLDEQWDANYREDPVLSRRFLLLNLSELKQLAAAGASVGAHTLSHPMVSQSSPEAAWDEIAESKRRLDQALGQNTWAFAYPFGDPDSVTSREVEMAERAGFEAAFLNVDAFASRISKFSLPRVHVTADMTLAEFEAHISGFHRSLQEWFRSTSRSAAARSTA